MKNRLPMLCDKRKICIICEGDEEYDYLNKLKGLNVWNQKYSVSLDNAGGNGNIPARYQDRYQNNSYDLVLVFCDTEKKPYEQYADIKRKINEFHGEDGVADEVVIYGNPCTMQVIVEHWIDVRLKSPAKKVNALLLERLTGVKNYKGREDQREKLMEKITIDNYYVMRERVGEMGSDDRVTGSSNFSRFINYLHTENDAWIERINLKLEG